ncbi:class IV adenylate cyclase [Acidobacteriota bacterium]
MLEIEIKIKIENLEDMAHRIVEQGAKEVRERAFEENILYDFPDLILTNKRQAFRLRKIKKKTYLTFKGSPQKSRQFKIREEYESEVKNANQIKKIIKSLGLIPKFRYDKFRTVFRTKKLNICLDETPVGNFIELEGEQNHIVKFASSLGFSRTDFIKKNYVDLYSVLGK